MKKHRTETLAGNDKIFVGRYFSYLEHEAKTLNRKRAEEILDGFLFDAIDILKQSTANVDEKSPILVCLVKNELRRMKRFFEHYRKIGIERFAIIDNDSDDGTREFCLAQKDADVFFIKQPFTSPQHVSWVNKILCHYGYNRWYLSVDSDELLDYIDSENKGIRDVASFAEKKFTAKDFCSASGFLFGKKFICFSFYFDESVAYNSSQDLKALSFLSSIP